MQTATHHVTLSVKTQHSKSAEVGPAPGALYATNFRLVHVRYVPARSGRLSSVTHIPWGALSAVERPSDNDSRVLKLKGKDQRTVLLTFLTQVRHGAGRIAVCA